MQEWIILDVKLSDLRPRVLAPRRSKADKPLEACLLAVSGVSVGGSGG